MNVCADSEQSTADFGAILNTGNSEAVSVRSAWSRTTENDEFRNAYQASLGYQKSRSGGDTKTTGQRVAASALTSYKLNSDYSVFGRAAYTNDRFASYRQEATLVAGAGAWIFKDTESSLELITGPGYRNAQAQYGTESGALWFASVAYKRSFGQNQFQQSLEFSRSLAGQNSTLLSRSAYVSTITGSLALRVALDIRNDSLPTPAKRATSTETGVSVQWTF